MGKDSGKLTARQNAFVAEYLVDLNATQAAIRAGYSKATARQAGAECLSKPHVRLLVDEALARRAARVEVKSDDVLRELLRLALSDLTTAFDDGGQLKSLKDLPLDLRRTISSLEVQSIAPDESRMLDDGPMPAMGSVTKVKMWDKVKALELLGKHLDLFREKEPVAVNVNIAMAPEWQGLRAELLTVLKRHPAALADVVVLLSAKSGQTVTVAPGASRALEAVVVEPS